MTYQRNETPEPLAAGGFVIGGRYNWKYQSERLIYMGHNWSGNGYWHQFALANDPHRKVWCEVLTDELSRFEQTQECDASHHHV